MRITLDTSDVRCCRVPNCKAKAPYYRHHKGCDHYIGRFVARIRKEYYLWHDCVDVCDHHHMVIHYMYGPMIREAALGWLSSPHAALRLRAKLITYCDNILAGKVELKKPTKEFRAKWKKRRAAWRKKTRLNRG